MTFNTHKLTGLAHFERGIRCRIQKEKPQSQFIKELQSSVFQTADSNPLVSQEINLYQFSQEIHHLGQRV